MVNPLDNKKELKKGLYLVSTPIGNLGDITFRAIETLKKSEYILCEDTRVSKVLLDKFGIKSKLISNHKFNEAKNIPKVIDLLKKRKNYFFDFRCWYTSYFRSRINVGKCMSKK